MGQIHGISTTTTNIIFLVVHLTHRMGWSPRGFFLLQRGINLNMDWGSGRDGWPTWNCYVWIIHHWEITATDVYNRGGRWMFNGLYSLWGDSDFLYHNAWIWILQTRGFNHILLHIGWDWLDITHRRGSTLRFLYHWWQRFWITHVWVNSFPTFFICGGCNRDYTIRIGAWGCRICGSSFYSRVVQVRVWFTLRDINRFVIFETLR